MFISDYILNGRGMGPSADVMESVRWETGLLRPFKDTDPSSPTRGKSCVIINSRRTKWDPSLGQYVPVKVQLPIAALQNRNIYSPVFNATTLRKEEWIHLDQVVLRAARYRLRAWEDLARANTFGGFNGMSKLILEHETQSDPGEAITDMNALTEGRTDTPVYQLEGLPLAVTHSDFYYDLRRLSASRNTGTPLDTTMAEACGRRNAEKIEKLTIGLQTSPLTYGGQSTQYGGYSRNSSIYGYLNHPKRVIKNNFTAPTTGGWTPETTQKEVNAALLKLRNQKFYGPFMVYHSNDWDTYLDGDYYVSVTSGAVAPTKTLRERLRGIDGVEDVKRLDFLFSTLTDQSGGGPGLEDISAAHPFTLIFVQMTPDVARAVVGLDMTTVQWEERGGLKVCFKVMGICVPQVRADYYGNCGVLHGTTS